MSSPTPTSPHQEPRLKSQPSLGRSRANLKKSILEDSLLAKANLKRADLEGANLQYADLRSADLNGANLKEVNLEGANLIDADLTNATGLTQEQIDSAVVDQRTKLPTYLNGGSNSNDVYSPRYSYVCTDNDDGIIGVVFSPETKLILWLGAEGVDQGIEGIGRMAAEE